MTAPTPDDDGCCQRIAPDTVRLVRLFPGPVERIWDFLVDPDKRALWLAGGPMELRVGGAVELQFRHADLTPHDDPVPDRYRAMAGGHVLRGTVTALDAPRLLAFTWGSTSEVRFELEEVVDRVLFTVTHTRLADDGERVSVSSGWHTHVELLESRLQGRVPGPFWARHAQLEALYRQREHNG